MYFINMEEAHHQSDLACVIKACIVHSEMKREMEANFDMIVGAMEEVERGSQTSDGEGVAILNTTSRLSSTHALADDTAASKPGVDKKRKGARRDEDLDACPVCGLQAGRFPTIRGRPTERLRDETTMRDDDFTRHAAVMSFASIARIHGFSRSYWSRRAKKLRDS